MRYPATNPRHVPAAASITAAIITLLVVALSPPPTGANTFTKIVSGSVVTDGGISGGNSWADYDNDGHLDLYVTNAQNNVNFLYHNEGGGEFTRISSGDIVTDVNRSSGNCWGDYDNDGDLDLFVSNQGPDNILYRNDGAAGFTRITEGAMVNDGGDSHHSTWGDYDNDGLLDMFVANGGFSTNGPNFLYRNLGNDQFEKIVEGGIVTNLGRTFGGNWADYDGDGHLDLFVAHWQNEDNELFHNDGGQGFHPITTGDIVNDSGYSIGSSWGDYDNDGDLDLFVANWGGQNNFLYRNDGDSTFTRITDEILVLDGGTSWVGTWGDYDNDGDLDLFVTNYDQNNNLYDNDGDGTFTKVTSGVVVTDGGLSSGACWGDYDNDGDLDLFVANWEEQNNYLYRNDGNANGWINILCRGTESNRVAIGARVRLLATIGGAPTWQMREITASTGIRSQNSLNVEFGLGDATIVDSLRVEWPSGIVDDWCDIGINQFIVVFEDGGVSSVRERSHGRLDGADLGLWVTSLTASTAVLGYTLEREAATSLAVFDVQGRHLETLAAGTQPAGEHQLSWRTGDVAAGIYYLRLQAGDVTGTSSFVLLK